MFTPPPLPDLKKLIFDCSSEKVNRETARNVLDSVLPQVRRYQAFCADPSKEYSDSEFDLDLKKLQLTVLDDFYLNKQTDWLTILQQYGYSPLTQQQIDHYLKPCKISFFSVVQDLIEGPFKFSKLREKQHAEIFMKQAQRGEHIVFPQDMPSVVRRVLLRLTEQLAIINHKVYHWTTLSNLQSIIRNKQLLGNHIIQEKGISFEKNALNTGDVVNGDGSVICLCPALVDDVALIRNKRIRRDLLRLTINLQKVLCPGKYNQFFKLFDFFAPPFSRRLKINSDLTIDARKKERDNPKLEVTVSLSGNPFTITIDKSDAIIYGDLYSINRFCLSKVFELFNSRNDLMAYLASLNENDIAKIFLLTGQAMTLFSEYNFNHSLNLSCFLIEEIYQAESNCLWRIHQECPEQYESQLHSILQEGMGGQSDQLSTPLIELLNSRELSVNGYKYHLGLKVSEYDYSHLPAEWFGKHEYIETRYDTNCIEVLASPQSAAFKYF
ncbi:hypothetical protein [Legionella quinlivanii]|uniref:hypothetical protein n=1 Tax=Legionella quinlivanii TaxID=45073 RepID=UPI0022440C5D|nr:hypothetical protein [Legionella quinlivanii]MCW8449610.1 hypothetical protein [Legionella quinlivanii]